jgi:hypothetical protein
MIALKLWARWRRRRREPKDMVNPAFHEVLERRQYLPETEL